jgi:hypothetical protein
MANDLKVSDQMVLLLLTLGICAQHTKTRLALKTYFITGLKLSDLYLAGTTPFNQRQIREY